MNSYKSRRYRRMQRKLNYKNKILSILLISVMVFGMIPMQAYSTVDTSHSDNVEIKDENLEKALKEEIKEINPDYNNGVITKEDIKLIIDIDLSNKGIKNLSGIENAVNLKNINLEGNEIADISMLGKLENLEEYNISNQKINLNLDNTYKSEVEFENILIDIDKSNVKPISGDNISLKDEKIVLFNLVNGENKKLVRFNSRTEKGEFSGIIELNVKKILKDQLKEDNTSDEEENLNEVKLSNIEVEDKSEDGLSISKGILRPNPNANIDLKNEFIVSSFGGTIANENGNDNSSIIEDSISKNYIKATDTGLGRYQTTSLTSKNKIDFSKSFKMKGKINQAGFNYTDGIAFAFHNQKGYKFGGGFSSNLGVYNYNGTGLKKSALVLEIDGWGNGDSYFGDKNDGIKDVHLGINRIIPYENPQVLAKKYLDRNTSLFNGVQNFTISWNAVNKVIKIKLANYELQKKIPNIEEILGGKFAYYTIGTAAGSENEDIITEVVYDSFTYTDFEIDNKIEYYLQREDEEIPILSSDDIGEEDTIIVKHKFYNRKQSSEYNSKLQLRKNNFRGKWLLKELSYNPKWYTPYVIENSFKTYSENSKVDDGSINANDFFNSNVVDIRIPANNGVRIIEYKVKIPKVLGGSRVKLEQSLRIGTPGMEYYECTDSRNAVGEKEVLIEDNGLRKGLSNNIKEKIRETRPVDLYGKIYDKEMKVLDIINLSDLGISNIKGLENCINATKINLSSNNDIKDISVLSQITGLKSLNISNNTKIIKESLGQLIQLETLFMDSANIGDSYAIEIGKLLNLKKLSLKNNFITNLNNLSNLNNIKELYLDNNKIHDLRPLKTQIENAYNYSITNQKIDIKKLYNNSGIFEFDNIVYNTNGSVNDIHGAEYNSHTNKVIWRNLPEGDQKLSYSWTDNNHKFSGVVKIDLNQVCEPQYLIEIPASLEMGDVLDESSEEYDPEIDKTSINYKPEKEVIKKNPIVYGMVGAKDIISIIGEDSIIGDINIYTDSAFTMTTNINNIKDSALVDVYKSFDEKLTGTASSKKEKLMVLNDTKRKNVFRIKAPISRFKHNNAEYKGTMTFIIEHVG